jgi:hypothetical protein
VPLDRCLHHSKESVQVPTDRYAKVLE